jgi:[NiFe] hydrogenase diaphorase moiety large subunit
MHAEAVAGIVDRIVARYHRDPTCMVQILREIQEACDWISPEAIDRLQTTLGVPRTKIEGVAGFYSFFTPSRAASIACCSPTTSPTACSATGR